MNWRRFEAEALDLRRDPRLVLHVASHREAEGDSASGEFTELNVRGRAIEIEDLATRGQVRSGPRRTDRLEGAALPPVRGPGRDRVGRPLSRG